MSVMIWRVVLFSFIISFNVFAAPSRAKELYAHMRMLLKSDAQEVSDYWEFCKGLAVSFVYNDKRYFGTIETLYINEDVKVRFIYHSVERTIWLTLSDITERTPCATYPICTGDRVRYYRPFWPLGERVGTVKAALSNSGYPKQNRALVEFSDQGRLWKAWIASDALTRLE